MSDDENPKDFKMQLLQQRKEEDYVQKRMHSAFMRGTEEVRDKNNNWLWIKRISKERNWRTDNSRTRSIIM